MRPEKTYTCAYLDGRRTTQTNLTALCRDCPEIASEKWHIYRTLKKSYKVELDNAVIYLDKRKL